MQKHNENLFSEKFRLLNSQEHVEDIKWSSSDESDLENISRNGKCSFVKNSSVLRKRKRKKTKSKNTSNLSITILDTSKHIEELKSVHKSPEKSLEKSPTFAPIVTNSRPQKKFKSTSPVLTYKGPSLHCKANLLEKSPILLMKHASPKVSPNVRKKLFKLAQEGMLLQDKTNTNDLFEAAENKETSLLDRRKPENSVKSPHMVEPKCKGINLISNFNGSNNELLHMFEQSEIIHNKSSPFAAFEKEVLHKKKIKIEIPESQEEVPKIFSQKHSLDDSFTILKSSNTELIKRAKSYFENHFSSGNGSQSQHSICDCATQKTNSKSSEKVEIISILTQVNSNKSSFQSELGAISKIASPVSSQSAEYGTEKSKKPRYKKDGLAFRLNALIKKQNANISLWQHERFLADNSKFLIPKGEHIVFLIQKVSVKYGCYLLDAIDVNDSNVIILISSIYVQDSNICDNMVFKLYEPYSIFDYKDLKLITNACKFECIAFKD